MAAQAYEDERAAERADAALSRLLQQLDEAQARELQSLRGRLDNEGRGGEFDASAAKIRADYEKWREQARAQRRAERARVTGRAVQTAPATRPSPPASQPG